MKQKSTLILDDEFIQYCKLNNILDVEKFAKEIFNKGFTLFKYGDKPLLKIEPAEIISKEKEEKIEKIIKPNIEQKIKKENDLYDE